MQVLLGSTFKDENDETVERTKEVIFIGPDNLRYVRRDKTGVIITLRDYAKEALIATFQDERDLSNEEKAKRYGLFIKVKDAVDPAEFTVDEVSLMKKLVGKANTILIYGQAAEMFEGKS